MEILSFLLQIAIMAICTLFGGSQIADAIRNFKKEKYFICGVDAIIAIIFITTIIQILIYGRWI